MALVLFVCKENTYRSQIAEALFNSMAKRDSAISASGAEPAKEISHDAIMLLKKTYGIDMSGQKPKMLTEKMLKSASRIITVCDPKDCVLLPKSYNAEHWSIPKFEGMNDEEKEKNLKNLYEKVKKLVNELEAGSP
ncbi:low molecular weight phosphatase family protein [Candidatus Marsarchaeota archaeon]|nr:low molecular weight phosphatase family protein [Candidatus Marsarchaeota archaeon]MCL5404724.1 low molecular weight phosphatase family protein [Candidatus Marsarchaeota archaeon]